jgi:ABC-2 type transport system ATP-binding protein
MMTTVTKPSSGQIQVAGYDVMRQSLQVKQCISVLIQQISVDHQLSVWENMEFHGSMHHIPNQKRQQFIKQWLEYVGLAERRDDLVKKLWGEGTKGCKLPEDFGTRRQSYFWGKRR